MICDPCRAQDHDACMDVDQTKGVEFLPNGKMAFSLAPGRMYRSCDCQHGGAVVRDEPLGDPTDC